MGIVFKARQRALNRIVAVKMLRSGSLAGKAEIKRFRIEAQAAARLQHPNIVSIHEVGEHEGHLFSSMEFIQGRSLSEIANRTPLPPVRAARYCRTIAQAMRHVLAMADNRELLSMLAQEPGRQNEYQETAPTNRYVQLLSSLFQEHAIEPNKRSRFENLLLSHHNGDVLANHNPHDPPGNLINVAPRDYFVAARDLPPKRRVYISKAFRSEAGHQKYKIAISVPLRDGSGPLLGVLSAMLETATNKVPAGVSSSRTQTARVAELDLSLLGQAKARANQNSGAVYAFFWHPKYEHGRTNLVVTRHAHVAQALTQPPGETVLVDKFYRDPVLAESWLYGWWVAGFARVGDTHLVVVHQIRNRAVQAVFLSTLLCALVALAGIASVLRKRRPRTGCESRGGWRVPRTLLVGKEPGFRLVEQGRRTKSLES